MKTLSILMILIAAGRSGASCLKIGLLGEFKNATGNFSEPFGNEIRRGAQIAKERLKTTMPGKCFTFEIVDINNSIANVDGYILRAAKSGIHYFVGLGTSNQALAARPALAESRSLLVTPTASSSLLLKPPRRTILMYPTNDVIAKALVNALDKQQIRKVVSIYARNNVYSRDMDAKFRSSFQKAGGQTTEIPVRAGHIEIASHLKEIQKTQSRFLFIPLFELDAAQVISTVLRNKLHVTFIGSDSWGTYSSVIKSLLKGSGVRALLPVVYDPNERNSINKLFVKKFRKRYHSTPTDLAAFSFDAVNLIALLEMKCGLNLTSADLRRCMRKNLPFASTMGQTVLTPGFYVVRRVRVRDIALGKKE